MFFLGVSPVSKYFNLSSTCSRSLVPNKEDGVSAANMILTSHIIYIYREYKIGKGSEDVKVDVRERMSNVYTFHYNDTYIRVQH